MIKNYISYLAGLLAACICLLNFEVNAGIKKKDFKSKTVSELIDVLKNDELLEKKIMEKIEKQLMCKLQLYSFSNELDRFKEDLKNSLKSMSNVPKAMQKSIMQDNVKMYEEYTISRLKKIDKYCN